MSNEACEYKDVEAYAAVTEGDTCGSMVAETRSAAAGASASASPSPCFARTGAGGASVVLGVAVSVVSLVSTVARAAAAPPLAAPRARVLPLPLALGGIDGWVDWVRGRGLARMRLTGEGRQNYFMSYR